MAPTNLTLVRILSRSATLTWVELPYNDQNGVIVGYIISVTEQGTGLAFQLVSMGTSFEVSNLKPYVTYAFAVAAITSTGAGPYSNAVTETTTQDGNELLSSVLHCMLA